MTKVHAEDAVGEGSAHWKEGSKDYSPRGTFPFLIYEFMEWGSQGPQGFQEQQGLAPSLPPLPPQLPWAVPFLLLSRGPIQSSR